MIGPRGSRLEWFHFRLLLVGCSRRSAVDTGQRTSADRTPSFDPGRSRHATRCGAASDDDYHITSSGCRDLLGHDRSNDHYGTHRTTPPVSRTPQTPHPHPQPPTTPPPPPP